MGYNLSVMSSQEIEQHRRNIDRFLREEDCDMARVSYFHWVEALRQENARRRGALRSELESAKAEFSNFARTDPLYLEWIQKIFPIVECNPGILQTELYRRFPPHEKENISYTLYFAADHEKVKRFRKGRTYSLFLRRSTESPKDEVFRLR